MVEKEIIKILEYDDKFTISAIKVPINYKYAMTILGMIKLLSRLGYHASTMIIEDGWWDIKPSDVTLPSKRIVGIGFFKFIEDKIPDVVINCDEQRIYILDEKHTKIFNELNNRRNIITLDFHKVFDDDTITWTDILDEMKEKLQCE